MDWKKGQEGSEGDGQEMICENSEICSSSRENCNRKRKHNRGFICMGSYCSYIRKRVNCIPIDHEHPKIDIESMKYHFEQLTTGREKRMELIEIIENYLKEKHFDGLFNVALECACLIKELMPCEDIHLMNPNRGLAPIRYMDKGLGYKGRRFILLPTHEPTHAGISVADNGYHSSWEQSAVTAPANYRESI